MIAPSPTTVGAWLLATSAQLAASSSSPRLDAELLLAHVLGWSRARLLAERPAELSAETLARVAALVERRRNLEPIAYILGEREFYGLPLFVDRRVLVPRPETELLVELALTRARQRGGNLRIADIGTGTGAIAIALAMHLPHASVIASDLSPEALAVAAQNLQRHGLGERVKLVQGDLLAALSEPVDLLVSNPPYTILAEIDEGVRRHEPHLALDGGGPQGLAIYERLLTAAPQYLAAGASLLLEIGAWQGLAVRSLAQQHLPMAIVQLHHDLAGHPRVISADLPLPERV